MQNVATRMVTNLCGVGFSVLLWDPERVQPLGTLDDVIWTVQVEQVLIAPDDPRSIWLSYAERYQFSGQASRDLLQVFHEQDRFLATFRFDGNDYLCSVVVDREEDGLATLAAEGPFEMPTRI